MLGGQIINVWWGGTLLRLLKIIKHWHIYQHIFCHNIRWSFSVRNLQVDLCELIIVSSLLHGNLSDDLVDFYFVTSSNISIGCIDFCF